MFREPGENAPQRLLLLPGMDGTDILFGPLRRALPGWLEPTVVRYPIDGDNRYETLLPLVLDAARALPACHVLGWSFSGPLALRLANALPERVRSVTLVATFVTRPLPWLGVVGPLLRTPLVGFARTLRRLPIWLGRAPDDPLRRDKARLWQTVPARTLAARARAIRTVDARDDLRRIRQPLLYVRSSHDTVVPEANVAAMRALRPDLRVETIPGNHFALYASAMAGAEVIARFVQRCEGEPSAMASG